MSKGKSNDFPCFICGNIYHTKEYLLLHTKIHAGEKSFTCDSCPKSFVNITALRNHMQTHMEKSYMCPTCGGQYHTKKSLKIHLISHSRESSAEVEITKEIIESAVQKVLQGGVVLKVAEELKVPYASLQRWLNIARQQNECNQCGKCFA